MLKILYGFDVKASCKARNLQYKRCCVPFSALGNREQDKEESIGTFHYSAY